MYNYDVLPRRMEEAIHYFGHAPGTIFPASLSQYRRQHEERELIAAMRNPHNLLGMRSQYTAIRSPFIHQLFDIVPGELKDLAASKFEPKSAWILDQLCWAENRPEAQLKWNLYAGLGRLPAFEPVTRRIWERGFHKYLSRIGSSTTWNLENPKAPNNPATIELAFGGCTSSYPVSSPAALTTLLRAHYAKRSPCYIYRTSPTLIGFSSVLYIPEHPLMFLRIAKERDMGVPLAGLDTTQG